MLKKLFYPVIICLTASFSLAQKTPAPISTPTDKQKVAVPSPTDQIVDLFLIIEGKVKTVYEGDTISVENKDGKVYLIRMQNIDAPEEKQDYYDKSKKKLGDLILGKDTTVLIRRIDSSDRYIGTVYSGGKDINLKQIETGMAWHLKQTGDEQKDENRKIYEQAEQRARTERAGLWEDKNPVAPWEFRNDKETKQSVSKDSKESVPKDSNEKPAEANTTNSNTVVNTPPSNKTNKARTYILGPRGGCYYISDSGNKVYVKDKSLCKN